MTAPKLTRKNYGKGHSYYLDGEKIPGVTSILGDGLAKPALSSWAAKTVGGYAVDNWDTLGELKLSERLKSLENAHYADRDAAGKRGTEVHKLAEALNAGKKVAVPDELAGHVEASVKFLDEHDPQVVLTEASVVYLKPLNEYAGTLDLVADFPALGQRLLCDVKTARSGVFPDNALQLAAYRYADSYLDGTTLKPMPQVDGCAVIHVPADGYSLVPLEAGPAEHRVFLYCRLLWRWDNKGPKTLPRQEHTAPRR